MRPSPSRSTEARMEGTAPCLSRRCPIVVWSFGPLRCGASPASSCFSALSSRRRRTAIVAANPSSDNKDLSRIATQSESATEFPFAISGCPFCSAPSRPVFSSLLFCGRCCSCCWCRCAVVCFVLWAISSAHPPLSSGAAPLFYFADEGGCLVGPLSHAVHLGVFLSALVRETKIDL